MDTKKLWGFILIGVTVALALWGITHLYAVFTFSSAMGNLESMYSGTAFAGMVPTPKAPSSIPGFILLVLSGTSAFFGTKLLKEANASK